jgi:hypothetical protein
MVHYCPPRYTVAYSTNIQRVPVRQTPCRRHSLRLRSRRRRRAPGWNLAHIGAASMRKRTWVIARGKQSGVWFVRWRNHHRGGNYKQAPVGIANDVNDKSADGTLTFDQSRKGALEAVAQARTEASAQAAGPAPTVRSAVEAYVKERDDRERRRTGREVRSDASIKLRRYVLGQEKRGNQEAIEAAPLAAVHLHALNENDLLKWREGLPGDLRATIKQRFANDLKAALNAAWPRLSGNPDIPRRREGRFQSRANR